MPWDGPEHEAPPEPVEDDPAPGADAPGKEPAADESVAGDDGEDATGGVRPRTDAGDLPPGPGREAAIEEAAARISGLGTLSAAAQDALVETLRHTQQQDWPVVIEEFAAALAATGGVAAAITAAEPAEPPASSVPTDVVAVSEPAPAAAPEPAPEPAPDAAEPVSEPVAEPTVDAEPVPAESDPAVAAEPTELGIDNACFATRVRGWGAVDRFPADEFHAGQELIVYFELDNLSCGTSAAGHTTCIDTALTLVDADGHTLHRWTFEPVAETSPARRRDYFARYVLALPGNLAAGPCRLEIAVADALSGGSATTSLPLEITAD